MNIKCYLFIEVDHNQSRRRFGKEIERTSLPTVHRCTKPFAHVQTYYTSFLKASSPNEASGTIVCTDGERVGAPTRPLYRRETTSPEWCGTHETWDPSFSKNGWESLSKTRNEWGGWKAWKVQQKLLTRILPRNGEVQHCLTRKKIETSSNNRSLYGALLRSSNLHLGNKSKLYCKYNVCSKEG